MEIFESFERYSNLVTHGLTETYKCPHEVATALVTEYEDVLSACWTGGVAAIVVIKLLYAEWKTFRQVPSAN